MNVSDVSAVIVTRGDHPNEVAQIVAGLPFDDIIVWDNSVQPVNMKVLGRHLAVGLARNETIYTQDDDCLCPARELVEAYDGTMLVNVPEDEAPLTAWGAVYSRQSVLDAFAAWMAVYPDFDEDLLLGGDLIHAYQTPWRRLDLGRVDFPFAYEPDRMHHQGGYYEQRARVTERALALGKRNG